MGKREVGSLSVFDLAVYFTISDLITVCIIDKNVPVILSIVSDFDILSNTSEAYFLESSVLDI